METSKHIFLQTDYRVALRNRLTELKHSLGSAFTTQVLAEKCEIQRTYLSKVLNCANHLNDDQIFSALNYLKFSDAEKNYLEILHQWQRASNKKRKELLQHKLHALQVTALKADTHISTPKLAANQEDLIYLKYYLNPQVQLAHVFLSIEAYQKNPEKIRSALRISKEDWIKILTTLFDLSLIKQEGDSLIAQQIQIFLSSDSPVFPVYHHLVKTFALPQIQKVATTEKNSLSVLFTCSETTWEKIRMRIVEMTKEIEKLVINDEKPEKVYQLSLDMFPWIQEKRSLQ